MTRVTKVQIIISIFDRSSKTNDVEAKVARGRNYDPNENEALCRAWIRVSGDPAVGVYQTAERF